MNVTLRQLRVFVAVARLRGFRRAGEEVGLTQSAVSRCIRELEGELGLRLMDRTTREVQLTAAGDSLVVTLGRLLADLDAALRETREIGEQRRGRVLVAASPTVASRILPGCVARCGERFPFITLVLRDEVQSDVMRQVKSGDADLGVIIGPLVDEGLVIESIAVDVFCLVCREDHPLAAQASVAWTDLDGLSLVMLDHASGSRPIIDRVLRENGVRVNVVQELAHSATVFGLVEAGVGLSVSPSLALPLPAGSPLVARPLVPRAERTVALVRRRERSLSPAADAVWGLIVEVGAQMPTPR